MARITSIVSIIFVCVTGSLAVDSLRFLVIGDMGGLPTYPYVTSVELGTSVEMATIADKYGVSFIMELGDNFYYDGVKTVDDPRFKFTFEQVYTAPSLQVPWYFVAGNHDHNGNVSAQIAYSQVSKRWNYPNFYYPLSFDIPNSDATIDFVMTDTVTLCGNVADDFHGLQPQGPVDIAFAETQWQWIDKTLAASKATYLFTTGHFPVYSIAEHGPTGCLVDGLMPMLQKYRANGHMCGHDHNLQHLQETRNGLTLDYILSGSANFVDPSTAHKDAVPPSTSKFHWADAFSKGGFVYAEATPQNMTVTYIQANGDVLYQTVVLPRKQ
ncbi:tartrate-resistant acid phosphatase type 5-like [Haliotis rufescens]|uniref:tartrate-resistant acid phosphatase type 5-like n=1 Tax=Haliotis rufescens TaxID=6454 RepID=UPI00201EA036|nr:tartrate-resistant acid phosphatase type 5-like [Haliotis rufescens]